MDSHDRRDDRERDVSRAELAEIMGVSVRTIDTFRAEGMPAVSWDCRPCVPCQANATGAPPSGENLAMLVGEDVRAAMARRIDL